MAATAGVKCLVRTRVGDGCLPLLLALAQACSLNWSDGAEPVEPDAGHMISTSPYDARDGSVAADPDTGPSNAINEYGVRCCLDL